MENRIFHYCSLSVWIWDNVERLDPNYINLIWSGRLVWKNSRSSKLKQSFPSKRLTKLKLNHLQFAHKRSLLYTNYLNNTRFPFPAKSWILWKFIGHKSVGNVWRDIKKTYWMHCSIQAAFSKGQTLFMSYISDRNGSTHSVFGQFGLAL